jgi:hypothetical protein
LIAHVQINATTIAEPLGTVAEGKVERGEASNDSGEGIWAVDCLLVTTTLELSCAIVVPVGTTMRTKERKNNFRKVGLAESLLVFHNHSLAPSSLHATGFARPPESGDT